MSTPSRLGVEVDIRSNESGLYISHDPFSSGEKLSAWLDQYRHAQLVLNVKEEGLEEACIELMASHGVSRYFFLDQSIPFLVKRGLAGHRDGACRVSDFESIESAKKLAEICEWVWVDSFEDEFDHLGTVRMLSDLGLKTCLVSPELHSPDRIEESMRLRDAVLESRVKVDAVCTKLPSMWDDN